MSEIESMLTRIIKDNGNFVSKEKALESLGELQSVKDQLREALEYAGKANLKELVKKAEILDEAMGLIKSIDAEMVKLGITHVHFKTEDFLTKHQLNSEEGR